MKRYAAKMLYQYRVEVANGTSRRLCETRIIKINARSAVEALRRAKSRARASEYSFLNSDQNRVLFEFIGIQELLCLDLVCDGDEVWYELSDRLRPMERKASLIPHEHELEAIRTEALALIDRREKQEKKRGRRRE